MTPGPTFPPVSTLPETLRPDHLYLFVMGPGTGESSVLRLPGGSWVVVDCCHPRGVLLPMVAILQRYQVSRLSALVLTHPHRDHYPGIPDLLDELEGVEAVAFLGALGSPEVPLDPRLPPFAQNDASLRQALKGCATTVRRLEDEVQGGARGVNLVAGATVLHEQQSGARLTCLSPPTAEVVTLARDPGWPAQIPELANRLSGVLRLDWGESCWVLGADLEAGGRSPRWEDLPPLHEHAGLKLPHHGSASAHSTTWTGTEKPGPPRFWALTPYNSSRLPRLDEPTGLPALLEHQEPILLTALPRSYVATVEGPSLRCADIARGSRAPADPGHDPPQHCVVGACFERSGRCLERYLEPGSREMVR